MNHPLEGDCEVVSIQTSTGSLERVGILAETGPITLESCESHIKTMVLYSQSEDCHCFLIDVSASELIANIGKQYEFAYQRAEIMGLRRSWRVALLIAPGDESHDFLKIATQNAGYSLRGFDDKSAAMKWLVELSTN